MDITRHWRNFIELTQPRLGALYYCRPAIGACSSAAPPAPATPAPARLGAAPRRPRPSGAPLTGSVDIDGSSTVYPITEAVAEEFQKANKGVKVTVAFAGTGGGFKKFCNGETDMNDASRPIKEDDAGEGAGCKAKGIEWLELGIATTDRASVAMPSSRYSMLLALHATPSPASSGLIGREASFMSVSPLQNFLKPPPVPANATVTLTPLLAFWNSSATASVIGYTVLEPSI